MALKTILFITCFAGAVVGALFVPLIGIGGYILHYCIGPEAQWWHAPISGLGIRYSFTLAIATAIGIALNWGKLEFKKPLARQEGLMLVMLGIIWLGVLVHPSIGEGDPSTPGAYEVVDHPSIKMTKIFIFAMMLTHVATRIGKVEAVAWFLIAGTLVIGMQAHYAPGSDFAAGRLEDVGGTDFREAGGLGGHMAAILPLIGVMFFRAGVIGKVVAAAAGALAMDTIVLTRSRSALIALAFAALVLALRAPRRYRAKIILGLLIAGAGFWYLTDPQFIYRSQTIFRPAEERDPSARARVEIWRGGYRMVKDKPFGVGTGNFRKAIGRYQRSQAGRDAHNTYIRCIAELGVQGLAVLLVLMVNGVWICRRIIRRAQKLPREQASRFEWLATALTAALISRYAYGLTGTLLYVEALWWYLMLPVCLERSLENALADEPAAAVEAMKQRSVRASGPAKASGRRRRARQPAGDSGGANPRPAS